MKVLYIAGFYSLKYGGFEKYTIELLKQGVDLSIVYNDFPSSQEYLKDLESLDARLYTVQGNLLKSHKEGKAGYCSLSFGLFALLPIFNCKNFISENKTGIDTTL